VSGTGIQVELYCVVICWRKDQIRGQLSSLISMIGHVTNVLASCAQTFQALRVHVLRSHGLNKDALEGVFKAAVIDKLTYASPAWWVSPRLMTAREWNLSSAVECVSATAPSTRLL